ncbi:hypothetical protein SOVF_053840 [Spinacia oleracea]|uniref:Uncharacterized protein n=1 Tax=Spinacia oleracea TaxID=3562 RepID=A0A9R0JB88_SPIOL|nr:uncharacterized protein LOC110803161 [Spinacia oleracea]KNA20284.1 hypothetical protein SOVF_053840 [Spinacia oleracea]
MAEDLDDGEFWLPSRILTDDDIHMDFDFSASGPKLCLGLGDSSSSASDLELTSGSTETESDEEDILLLGLTHQLARSDVSDSSCPVHFKGYVLSSSPQSTLCGCLCNQGSSRESLSGPVSPPQPPPQDNNDLKKDASNATLDLLNKAAGEVARLKMRNEKSIGTGFFDCSQKGVLYPPPLTKPEHLPPIYYRPQFHHYPPMFWAPSNGVQYIQPKQQPPPPTPPPTNRAIKNSNTNNSSNTNPPLGLPLSAWPLPKPRGQTQTQTQPMPAPPIFVGPKRECTGTGVFLPRCVTISPSETRKKSDGNLTKSLKSGKGSQSQSNHRRNARTTTTTTTPTKTTVNHNEIQLPQEWTY